MRWTFCAAITGAVLAVPITAPTATANADTVNWDAIAQCESGGNWSSNTGNGAFGGLQFKPATWAANGGVGNPATASRDEQIRVAENVLATQGLGAWPKCGGQAGNPAAWSATGAVPCQMLPGGLLGIFNLQRMCATIMRPLGAAR